MSRKWKILIIILLLVISYSIFETSKFKVHTDLMDMSINPYNTYDDPNRSISLLAADDTEYIKHQLMTLSDQTQVSLILPVIDPNQVNSPVYYWYIQDDKYLSGEIILNKDLDVETFKSLEKPITNHSSDEYYFDFPLDGYDYKIYPFHQYDESNISSQITIFADSQEKLDEFTNGLDQLGILHIVNQPFDYETSFFQTISLTILENPLGPLTVGLFLILIFTILYQDRRNLSIKLVNGYSKTKYILEKIKDLSFLLNTILFGGFLVLYLISYSLNFNHFLPMLFYYLPLVLLVNLVVMVLVAIIVYSFTDINQTTYVQGIRPKALTSHIIGASKFVIGLLICLVLIPSIQNILHTGSIYRSMSRQMEKYSDIHILNFDGNYSRTVFEKSDEIIEALEDFDNIIYQSHFQGGETEEAAKVVRVNSNYIKRHPILDENQNPIDPNRTNVVYTKAHNMAAVERLKKFGGFLGGGEDNKSEIETIILDDDAELTMYNMDPFTDDDLISKDFILVPQNDNLFILQLLFAFENEEEIEDLTNELEGIVDTQSIHFTKISDRWASEIDIYGSMIRKDAIKIANYLILMVVLSLIYYQIKLDKVRKEFSIYWVNGISKFNNFYLDYLYQIILSATMIILVRLVFYPDISMALTLIIFLIYILIDTISLAIFRDRFYSQLQKNIKEQV